jgi:4-amino-4-deoxychorismate lyase
VTLAYFLRYPNPYSTHVLSTDVIDRRIDPVTKRLHTVRLHLKRSKLPSAVLKLLPKSILGATSNDASQAYILEKSVVDVNEGWMETESQNLEWTGVLSVVERQVYRRPLGLAAIRDGTSPSNSIRSWDEPKEERTDVTTTVTFHSRLGQSRLLHPHHWPHKTVAEDDPPAPRKSFFQSWSTSSIQRSIELIGVRRTRDQLIRSKEGMKVVLERLREGGLVGVLEGTRRDREAAFSGGIGGRAGNGPWRRVWKSDGGGVAGTEQGAQQHTADDHQD